MKEERKIKILIAKPGLDGHDRGAKAIAYALRDSGFEVIYTGIRQTPEAIAKAAIQEDVDIVGLSCLSGSHNGLFPKVVELLKKQGVDNIVVIGGGIIPGQDIPFLKEKGIKEVFTSGSPVASIVDFIRKSIRPQ